MSFSSMERRRQLYKSRKRLRPNVVTGIRRLPTEMLCNIMAFLDPKTLLYLARTCRRFYNIVRVWKERRYVLYFPMKKTITMLYYGRNKSGRSIDPMDLVYCANHYKLLDYKQTKWRKVLCMLFWEQECLNYIQQLECPKNIELLSDLNLALYSIAMLANRPYLLDAAQEKYKLPLNAVTERDENSIQSVYFPLSFREANAIWCLHVCPKKDLCTRLLTAKCIQHDWHRALGMMHATPLAVKRVLGCPNYLESLDLTSPEITRQYLYNLFATSDKVPLTTRCSALRRYVEDARDGAWIKPPYKITTKKLKTILKINLPELVEPCVQLLALINASDRLLTENAHIVDLLYPRHSIYLFPYCFRYITITQEHYNSLLDLIYDTPMGCIQDSDARRRDLLCYQPRITL